MRWAFNGSGRLAWYFVQVTWRGQAVQIRDNNMMLMLIFCILLEPSAGTSTLPCQALGGYNALARPEKLPRCWKLQAIVQTCRCATLRSDSASHTERAGLAAQRSALIIGLAPKACRP